MVFKNKLLSLLNELTSIVLPADKEGNVEQSDRELVELVDEARRNWLAASSLFNNVTDPDLVDHAVYALNAAERKYIYLWKKARCTEYHLNGSRPNTLSEEVK